MARRSVLFGVSWYMSLFFSVALAAEVQVDKQARDCNDLERNPFCTIQAALVRSQAGDIIVVHPGVYTENLDFHGKSLLLRSDSGGKNTIINGLGRTVVSMGPNAVLTGFTIRDGSSTSIGAGILVNGSGNEINANIIENNRLSNGGYGAGIGGSNAQVRIDGNIFRENKCGTSTPSGVISFRNASSVLIKNNIFENNLCSAIDMALPVSGRSLIVNNTIIGNRVGIYIDRNFNISQQFYSNNILYKNDVGLEIFGGRKTVDPSWDNNLVFGNGVNYKGIDDFTGRYGNLSALPRFANISTSDYRLRATSPAVDRGTRLNAPQNDFFKNPRPVDGNGDSNNRADIGAFETQRPVAKAGPNRNARSGKSISLNAASSSDRDGKITSYQWKVVRGSVLRMFGQYSATPSLTPARKSRQLWLELTVQDDLGFSSKDIIKIAVKGSPRKKSRQTKKKYPKIKPGKPISTKTSTKKTIDRTYKTMPLSKIENRRLQPQSIPPMHSQVEKQEPFTVASTAQKLTPIKFNIAKPTSYAANALLVKSTPRTLPNLPPIAKVGTDFVVNKGATCSINGTFSNDPDGKIISYRWQQTHGPTVILNKPHTDIALFTAPTNPTILIFQLTVTDDMGATATDSVTVTVKD